MLEVLNSDYVRLARAKGLRRGAVMIRHALRTALIPLATVTALDIAAHPRRRGDHRDRLPVARDGHFLLDSVAQRRRLRGAGAGCWSPAIVVIVVQPVADLLYAVLDPRIRYE